MNQAVQSLLRHRSPLVVVVWGALALGFAIFSPSLTKVGVQSESALLPSGSPSQRAQATLERLFPGDPTFDAAVVVLSRERGLEPQDLAYLRRLVAYLSSPAMRAQVGEVESPLTNSGLASVLSSPDRSADLVVVGLRAAPFTPQAASAVRRIRAWLGRTAPPGLAHPVTGTEAIGSDEATGISSSFARTSVISVLLVIAILVAVYRSLVTALVPLVTIAVSYLVAEGLVATLAAHGLKVASLAAVFMVVLVFGAGTDYCLFLVARYRRELAAGAGKREALLRARAAVAPVLVASASTVVLAFLAQLTARFGMYRTMGPAIGVAVAVTLVASLTLTPALFDLLGDSAFFRTALRAAHDNPRALARWHRLAELVRSRPRRLGLGLTVALLVLASPALWLHESYDLLAQVPASSGAARGARLLARHFASGDLAPIEILVQTPGPIRTPARLAALDRLTDVLKRVPGVAQVRSATQPTGAPITARVGPGGLGGIAALDALGLNPNRVDVTPLYSAMASPEGLRLTWPVLARYQQLERPLSPFYGTDGHSTRLFVAADAYPFSAQGLELVPKLSQAAKRGLADGALSDASVQVGGAPAAFFDIGVVSSADFHRVVLVVVAVTLFVLGILLRSVVAPFYLVGTVLLSYAAALGCTVLVFSTVLHKGSLPFWLPPMLFVILVALGADYNMFLTKAMKDALDAGLSPDEAALSALVDTGPVITQAGLVLAGTFFALLFAPLSPLAEAGFAVTVGVLVDTFFVRGLLVPSIVVAAGDRALTGPSLAELFGGLRRLGIAGTAVAAASVALASAGLAEAVVAHPYHGAAARHSALMPATPVRGTSVPTTNRPLGPLSTSDRRAEALANPITPPSVRALGKPGDRGGTLASTSPIPAAPDTGGGQSSTQQAAASTTTTTHAVGAVPAQIAVPTQGAFLYHLSGTRRIGAAGSTEPFSEDVATEVSYVAREAGATVVRLSTSSNAGSETDERRYEPAEVDWLSTEVSSAALSYGGTFSPPVPLVFWPPQIGSSWTTRWTTGNTSGQTTTTITGTEQVTVSGTAYTCWVTSSVSQFSGSVDGTQHTSSCWVPQLGMSAVDHEVEQGTYDGVGFSATTDAVLYALP